MIAFSLPPPLGTLLKLDEQVYELRETRPATRNDGMPTMLLVWESACPACGEPFEYVSGLRANSVNRRCQGCKKPTKPVKGKRSRKVKWEVVLP